MKSSKLTLTLKLWTDSLSLSSGCNLFQRDVALYSDLWPVAVRKSGILNISDFLVVRVIEELRGKLIKER